LPIFILLLPFHENSFSMHSEVSRIILGTRYLRPLKGNLTV
jgi:hypothetical protein